MIEEIEEELDLLKNIAETKKTKSKILLMHNEYELIYTSIMLKIDLKHASNRIKIASLLSHKHNR